MLTLNQIKYKLIDWFNNHAQINDVKYMDDFDFNAERNLTYPVVNMEWLDSDMQAKEMRHRVRVMIGDLHNENIEGHCDEIYSDCLLIAEDFFAWLQDYEGFNFIRSTSIQKFIDDTHDRTAGIVFTITLSTIRSQNTCATPTKS